MPGSKRRPSGAEWEDSLSEKDRIWGGYVFRKKADQFAFIWLNVPACSASIFIGESAGAGKI
jgi:hypothetical protein